MSELETELLPLDTEVKDAVPLLEWVRPVMRRIDLNDSQAAGGVTGDGNFGYS